MAVKGESTKHLLLPLLPRKSVGTQTLLQQSSGARLENDTWREDQGQGGLYR